MASISDIIEQFIQDAMGADSTLNLSRNELAQVFDCAPSQINYVLATRFTTARGYLVESRRGGGGYITVARMSCSADEILGQLEDYVIEGGIDQLRAGQIIDFLCRSEILTPREGSIVKSCISDRAIVSPTLNKEIIRANILKNMLLNLMKEDEE